MTWNDTENGQGISTIKHKMIILFIIVSPYIRKKSYDAKKSPERSTYLLRQIRSAVAFLSKILLRMFIFAHIHLLSCVVLGQFGRPWLITKAYLSYAPRIASSSCKESRSCTTMYWKILLLFLQAALWPLFSALFPLTPFLPKKRIIP